MSQIVEEVGRVELARAKATTIIVGFNLVRDVVLVIEGDRPELSPQATIKLRKLLHKAGELRGDD